MSGTKSIVLSLPESILEFVDSQVAFRGLENASEYVAALLREAQESFDRRIERLVLEGLDSGDSGEMTDADWEHLRRVARERRQSKSG